jgi:hypothetical protein
MRLLLTRPISSRCASIFADAVPWFIVSVDALKRYNPPVPVSVDRAISKKKSKRMEAGTQLGVFDFLRGHEYVLLGRLLDLISGIFRR